MTLPRRTPVAVLIGERTFSSGEVTHVRALMPEARVRDTVTGTNREGTGFVPDLPCDRADALDAAVEAVARGSRPG